MTIPKNSLYYTEKFVILYRIIRYCVNEFAYNEGLISQDVEFVISRGDCRCFAVKREKITKKKYFLS
jgi:hypothetical protein